MASTMPEGDTIWRSALRLRRALAGRRIATVPKCPVEIPAAELEGSLIGEIEARGKALLIRLEKTREMALFTHMGMTGSWHLYRRGEAWRKPPRRAHLVLSVSAGDAVLFTPSRLEYLPAEALAGHDFLRRLGPDLLAPGFDLKSAAERMGRGPDREIALALLDQELVAGIGNIFKSETLFAAGIDPRRRVAEFSAEAWQRIIAIARDLMLPCVADETRTVRDARRRADRYYVYQRKGRPCFRCGTPISFMRQGEDGRSTYFCSECQS
jgi:endonuclease VIII